MAQIVLGESEGIDSVLRRFKCAVSKAGIFPDMRKCNPLKHRSRNVNVKLWLNTEASGDFTNDR